ncbi:hypothetical protein AX17_004293 [Amanita inopinata Kibby_2008]|nr:hypothetical protein AX17_004293 [Amanita inopinata Kibby_2008]
MHGKTWAVLPVNQAVVAGEDNVVKVLLMDSSINPPDPHCHAMQENRSAVTERAKVRELLARQADGDLEAEQEIASESLYQHLSYGLAYTIGSALGRVPPSVDACLEAFSVTNSVGLTAGARAWSKHFHRSTPTSAMDSGETVETKDDDTAQRPKKKQKKEASAGWWGVAAGPIAVINEKALVLFWKVMNGATWRNLHWLPHEVLVYEVRVAEGYGMRWSHDWSKDDSGGETEGRPTWTFRGFVEPTMENGHEVSSMSSRYIKHSNNPADAGDWEVVRHNVTRTLVNSVEAAYENHQSFSGPGVYIGLSGLVLMESRIASIMEAGLNVPNLRAKSLNALADRHLALALRIPEVFKIRGTRTSFLETGIGIATLAILRYRSMNGDSSDDNWNAYIEVLERAVQHIIHEDNNPSHANDDGCEVLYGRAGLLYAFLLLRRAIHRGLLDELPPEFARQLNQMVALDNLRIIVDSIMCRGRRGSTWLAEELGATPETDDSLPPLMWSWYQKRYLGGAHGVAGILQMLLSCPAEIVAPYMDDILYTVEWLLTLQDQSGNWPSSFKLHKHHGECHQLLQWCHGAPGFLMLLSTVLRLSRRSNNPLPVDDETKRNIALSLHLGAVLVYKHGLLRKGVGPCHGVAGSVYALLAVADVSAEIQRWLSLKVNDSLDYFAAAVHLSELATHVEEYVEQEEMRIPDRPWSLYEGKAGMCCAWAEVLLRIQARASGRVIKDSFDISGMPGYSDFTIEA